MKKVLIVCRHAFTLKQNSQLRAIFGADTIFERHTKTIEKSQYLKFYEYCKKFDAIVAVLPDDLLAYLVKRDIIVIRPEFKGNRGHLSFAGWYIVEEFNYKTRPITLFVEKEVLKDETKNIVKPIKSNQ